MVAGAATAQEALQNMMAGDSAATARAKVMNPSQGQPDYTFKEGDFRLLVVPSMGLQWSDNVNLAQTNIQSDFLITPAIGITASYPFSERNLLFLDITGGYNWYLQHSQYSSFTINSSSGTGLSFDFVVKDVTLDLHDRINYSQGESGSFAGAGNATAVSSGNATVANTATFGSFQNTAGILALWDLNQVTLSLGYDHQNTLATTTQFNEDNQASELLSARASLLVHPQITVGLEATATFTSYEANELNNNNAYTIGPYVIYRPGKFFTIAVHGGYSIYEFSNTSTNIQTASQSSWYVNLDVSHQATEWLNYGMQIGRETQLGQVSDLVQDWYVRPHFTLMIIRGLDLNGNLFYEHGDQGVGSVGNLPGYSNGTFDFYGGGLGLQHALTARFSVSLNYTHTERTSSTPNNGYAQNVVAVQLSYHSK
jgi:hypothetical protein